MPPRRSFETDRRPAIDGTEESCNHIINAPRRSPDSTERDTISPTPQPHRRTANTSSRSHPNTSRLVERIARWLTQPPLASSPPHHLTKRAKYNRIRASCSHTNTQHRGHLITTPHSGLHTHRPPPQRRICGCTQAVYLLPHRLAHPSRMVHAEQHGVPRANTARAHPARMHAPHTRVRTPHAPSYISHGTANTTLLSRPGGP